MVLVVKYSIACTPWALNSILTGMTWAALPRTVLLDVYGFCSVPRFRFFNDRRWHSAGWREESDSQLVTQIWWPYSTFQSCGLRIHLQNLTARDHPSAWVLSRICTKFLRGFNYLLTKMGFWVSMVGIRMQASLARFHVIKSSSPCMSAPCSVGHPCDVPWTSTYMYVCMYVYIYIHTHACTCVGLHVHMFGYM